MKGLNALTDGYLYFPKEVLSPYSNIQNTASTPQRGLTNKEIIILQLLAKGFRNMEIATQLKLSNKTVSGHKVNILRKLGVRTSVGLATVAAEMGLV